MSTLTQANIMELLKSQTAEHHRRAEQQPLQQALVRGTATREQYAAWLGQMMHLHAALEAEIVKVQPDEPRLDVVTEDQFGEPRLADDLRAIGIDPAGIRPSPATAVACDRLRTLASSKPVSLLGLHYVLEGSKNGNKFIAMALRRSLGLPAGHGDTYLDPYGDEQRAKWQEFRTAMGAQAYTPQESDAIIAAAASMFDNVSSICAAIA